jgi:hypothetical protein
MPSTKFSLAELRKSKKYSDLVLECDNREFKVHKAIVFSQSRVLAAPFEHGFKVLDCLRLSHVKWQVPISNVAQESVDNRVVITQFRYDTVERMIEFMYEQSYTCALDRA